MNRFLLIASFIAVFSFSSQAQRPAPASPAAANPVMRFYPNPATTVVTFDFQKGYDKGYSLQIFNFLGRKMYESLNAAPKTTINLSSYTRGIYVYQLRDKSGRIVESGKFQVSK